MLKLEEIPNSLKQIKCFHCGKEIEHGKHFGDKMDYEIDYHFETQSFIFEHLRCHNLNCFSR